MSAGPRKVRNESKTGYAKLRLSAVEFCDDVGSADSLPDHHHRSGIARFCLPVEGFLNARVADQHEGSWLKVEVNNTGAVLLLEAFEVLLPGLGNRVAHFREVLGALGELLSANRDEFFCGNAEVLSGTKIRGFGDVEGEKGVNAVGHIVRGVTCGLSDRNSFGPEDLR